MNIVALADQNTVNQICNNKTPAVRQVGMFMGRWSTGIKGHLLLGERPENLFLFAEAVVEAQLWFGYRGFFFILGGEKRGAEIPLTAVRQNYHDDAFLNLISPG